VNESGDSAGTRRARGTLRSLARPNRQTASEKDRAQAVALSDCSNRPQSARTAPGADTKRA
jgi:hypothetical protein